MGQLLRPEELSEFLQISTNTLGNWRTRRVGPHFIRIQGGVVRYRRDDVDRWVDEQASTSRDWMDS